MTALILIACTLSGLCIARPIIATMRNAGATLDDMSRSERAAAMRVQAAIYAARRAGGAA